MPQVNSVQMTPAQYEALKQLSKQGAAIQAGLILGELAVAAFGGASAVMNKVPFTETQISQSWDGVARIAVGAGSIAAAADAGRRSKNLVESLKALS
jgi:hypothetical protein